MSNLDWPEEFERTAPTDREPYPGGFQVTRSTAFQNVLEELQRWDGVTDVQVDSGAKHQKRNPNMAYARASFDDPGVVVRFTKDGEQMAAACDCWDSIRDNAQDLYHYLHETRMQGQRGTVTAQSEYDKLRLPDGNTDTGAAGPPPHIVLGVDPDASDDEIQQAFRKRAKDLHPDSKHGGNNAFRQLKRARDELLSDDR
jgi:hypothetical protein